MNTMVIKGNVFSDKRGTIRFVNEFDFKDVKRFYSIKPDSTDQVRAWQGHQYEQKWFFVAQGSFEVKLVKMDQHCTALASSREQFILTEKESEILFVPGGYLNGFRALEANSILIVYSNFTLDESKSDDVRLNLDELAW